MIRCTQCKGEIPITRGMDWGYKLGANMYFCTYGCMRAKQADITEKQKETWERKQKQKEAKQKQTEAIVKQDEMTEKDEVTVMENEAKMIPEAQMKLEALVKRQSETIDNLTERLAREQKKNRAMAGMLRIYLDEIDRGE